MPTLTMDMLLLERWSPSDTARSLAEDVLPRLGKQTQDHAQINPANDFPACPAGIEDIDARFEGAYERQKDELTTTWKSSLDALHDRLLEGVQLCESEMAASLAAAAGHPQVLEEVVSEWMWFTQSLMKVGRDRYRSSWRPQPDWEESQWIRQRKQAFWEAVLDHVPAETLPLTGPKDVMDWGLLYAQVRSRAQRCQQPSDLARLRPWLTRLIDWAETLDQPGTRWSCSSPRQLAFTQASFGDPDDRGDQARRLDHEASSDNRKELESARRAASPSNAWQAWLLERGIPDHPVAYRDWSALLRSLADKKGSVAEQCQALDDTLGQDALGQWLIAPERPGGIVPSQAFAYMKRYQLPGLMEALTQRQVAHQRAASTPEAPPSLRSRHRVRS